MNIPFHRPYIVDEEIDAVMESLKSGWTTMGRKTIEFEEKFAAYIGMPHAVAVNSCTSALHMCLMLAEAGPGDEVIIPTTTFVATAEVVEYCGARPVLVEIEKDTHCLNVSNVERLITDRTKAVIPVHFSGQPCDLSSLHDMAKQHGIYVFEDAAHALPAWYRDNRIGTLSDATCFSFYATKTLATGEGGMIITGNDEWTKKLETMRLHGMNRDAWKRHEDGAGWEYDVTMLGYKYNTTDLNASLGLAQLDRVDWMHEEREKIAKKYADAFAGNELLIPYVVKEDRRSSWHLYPLKLNLESLKIDRNECIRMLHEKGINTGVHFKPIYRFTYYDNKYKYNPADFPVSEWVFERELSLPIFPGMTGEEVDYVIDTVLDIVNTARR